MNYLIQYIFTSSGIVDTPITLALRTSLLAASEGFFEFLAKDVSSTVFHQLSRFSNNLFFYWISFRKDLWTNKTCVIFTWVWYLAMIQNNTSADTAFQIIQTIRICCLSRIAFNHLWILWTSLNLRQIMARLFLFRLAMLLIRPTHLNIQYSQFKDRSDRSCRQALLVIFRRRTQQEPKMFIIPSQALLSLIKGYLSARILNFLSLFM